MYLVVCVFDGDGGGVAGWGVVGLGIERHYKLVPSSARLSLYRWSQVRSVEKDFDIVNYSI